MATWHNATERAPEAGQLRVLIVPKMDREAHLINIPVLAEKGAHGMRYLMERGNGWVKYLDTLNDYTIVSWCRDAQPDRDSLLRTINQAHSYLNAEWDGDVSPEFKMKTVSDLLSNALHAAGALEP